FVKYFSELEQAKGYSFKVPPKSAKHAGGIRASDQYIFGRTGRPLNDAEKALNKDEIYLARIPIAFAVGSAVNISSLSLQELSAIFTGELVNWKELGGPDAAIMTIGREETEALFLELKEEYPVFKKAQFVQVAGKDDAVINLLQQKIGQYGIGFGAKPNFDQASVSTVATPDFSAGVNLGLVYDKKNKEHPLVKLASEFAASEEWAKALNSLGVLPPK
ncbi:hypothetical protein CSA56_00260, partial [candidate division KSB3 bacterium]